MARKKTTWCKVINIDHDRKIFDVTGPKDKENYAAAVRHAREARAAGRDIEMMNTPWYGIYEDIPSKKELIEQYKAVTGYEWGSLMV